MAVASLAATGLLHLVLSPEHLSEKAYVGALFIVGGIAAIALAASIWRTNDARAWAAGGLTATGMAVGFILSRTTGLPGYHEAEWELSGLISVVLEAFVAAAAVAALRVRAPRLAQAR